MEGIVQMYVATLAEKNARIAELEAFADKIWKLSMAVQAELDNGDSAEVNGRLVEIAEAARQLCGNSHQR